VPAAWNAGDEARQSLPETPGLSWRLLRSFFARNDNRLILSLRGGGAGVPAAWNAVRHRSDEAISIIVDKPRLLRLSAFHAAFARNDIVRCCHCEERSDEAISAYTSTGDCASWNDGCFARKDTLLVDRIPGMRLPWRGAFPYNFPRLNPYIIMDRTDF